MSPFGWLPTFRKKISVSPPVLKDYVQDKHDSDYGETAARLARRAAQKVSIFRGIFDENEPNSSILKLN